MLSSWSPAPASRQKGGHVWPVKKHVAKFSTYGTWEDWAFLWIDTMEFSQHPHHLMTTPKHWYESFTIIVLIGKSCNIFGRLETCVTSTNLTKDMAPQKNIERQQKQEKHDRCLQIRPEHHLNHALCTSLHIYILEARKVSPILDELLWSNWKKPIRTSLRYTEKTIHKQKVSSPVFWWKIQTIPDVQLKRPYHFQLDGNLFGFFCCWLVSTPSTFCKVHFLRPYVVL